MNPLDPKGKVSGHSPLQGADASTGIAKDVELKGPQATLQSGKAGAADNLVATTGSGGAKPVLQARQRLQVLRPLANLAQRMSQGAQIAGTRAAQVAVALVMVGMSAALAGCEDEAAKGSADVSAEVAPLAAEVKANMPIKPGNYQVLQGSLQVDQQQVFAFTWLAEDGKPSAARVSDVRIKMLDKGEKATLEVPEKTTDSPILSLPEDIQVPMVGSHDEPRGDQPAPAAGVAPQGAVAGGTDVHNHYHNDNSNLLMYWMLFGGSSHSSHTTVIREPVYLTPPREIPTRAVGAPPPVATGAERHTARPSFQDRVRNTSSWSNRSDYTRTRAVTRAGGSSRSGSSSRPGSSTGSKTSGGWGGSTRSVGSSG